MNPQDIWLYNIHRDTWIKRIDSKGEHPPMFSSSCAALLDLSLYLFAGCSSYGSSNDMYVLDLMSLTWRKPVVSEKPSKRNKLGCWVHGQKIIYFGGFGEQPSSDCIGKGKFLPHESRPSLGWNNDLLSYDTEKNQWTALPVENSAPVPRAAHACAKSGENTGYMFGGRHLDQRLDDLYSIQLDSSTWTRILTDGRSPVGRSWHSLSAIDESNLLIFGGITTDEIDLGDCWLFDIEKRKWNELLHIQPGVRRFHTACKGIHPGQIMLFGGCRGNHLFRACEHLNEMTVIQISPLSLLRATSSIKEDLVVYEESVEPAASVDVNPNTSTPAVEESFSSLTVSHLDQAILQLANKIPDDAEKFAISLVETFRRLPLQKFQLAKMKVHQVLYDIEYNQ